MTSFYETSKIVRVDVIQIYNFFCIFNKQVWKKLDLQTDEKIPLYYFIGLL